MEEQETKNGRRFYPRPVECDQEINPELSLEQLLKRRAEISAIIGEIEENINSIEDQLNLARQEKELTGELLNVEWVSRATSALRGYRRVHREHERALKVVNRRIQPLRHKNEKEAFITIAKELLPTEMFHRIWGRVRQELQPASGESAVGAE